MPLFRAADAFEATILAAAERLRLPSIAVEKDYWVTEALRELAFGFKEDFVFKGGTSLTKALHVTDRFSEDIDLLILKKDRTRGACDRLMKAMAAAVQEKLAGNIESRNAETGRHRTYALTYPGTQEPAGILRPTIELEMGVRGGPHPSSQVEISSLLKEELHKQDFDTQAYSDLSSFSLLVLHPARTLIEKLFNVQSVAVRLERGEIAVPPARTERHLFDIHELLGIEEVIKLLSDREEFDRIVASVREVSQEFFSRQDEEPIDRPNDGFGESPAFVSTSSVDDTLRRVYEQNMPALYYGNRLPTWLEVKDRVKAHKDLL